MYTDKYNSNKNILKNEINEDNYEDIIANMIGDEGEIKFFKLIYPYFKMIPSLNWYKFYKIMINYKDNKKALEFFSDHFKTIYDYELRSEYMKDKKFNPNLLIDYEFTEEQIKEFIPFLIEYNIPLLLFNDNLIGRSLFYNIIEGKIKLGKINFLNYKIDSCDIYCSIEKIVENMICVHERGYKRFSEDVLGKISNGYYDKRQLQDISLLTREYVYLFTFLSGISFPDWMYNKLSDTLISLIDKSKDEKMLYLSLFNNIRVLTRKDFFTSLNVGYSRDKKVVVQLNDLTMEFNHLVSHAAMTRNKRILFTYILLFIMEEKRFDKFKWFLEYINGLLSKVSSNKIVINDELIKTAFYNSKEVDVLVSIE